METAVYVAGIQDRIDNEFVWRLGLVVAKNSTFSCVYKYCTELALYQNVMYYLISTPNLLFHGHGHDFELIDIADSICAKGNG